jgi:HTH-type transcriptional regulator, bacterioopsin transcriptional activator and related proteins
MNFASPFSPSLFAKCATCDATLSRLVGNLKGFVYRRRHDPQWTMEFLSDGFRDVTGYDPHRFIANASIAFGDLIARADWKRVTESVELATHHHHRLSIHYLIRTAYGAWARVEDRLTPVVDDSGKVRTIEGVIDLV